MDHITVACGAAVLSPIRAINCSEEIWGQDAKEFKPERWLDNESGLTSEAKEISGYHHILSFGDGPRTCLGRAFAVAEFKVMWPFSILRLSYPPLELYALISLFSVLIRNYVFDLRDGPETKLDLITSLLPRPKVVGEEGYNMPMRVCKFEY